MHRSSIVLAGVATVALLTSCAAVPVAAPTPVADEPTVLSFAFTGGFAEPQIGEFERLVAESDTGLEFAVDGMFDTDSFGIEQKIVDAVASGALDLGWIGVRGLAELGVHDFDALIAPLLIDSIATERAVLDTDIPTRMLTSLDEVGVVGLAVMGGPLRAPIAAETPLVDLAGFAGIPFYAWHGEVNGLSVTALGAQHIDVSPPERNAGIEDGSIRGYENTLAYLAETADRRANIMTVNVALWPSVGVLIANPAALEALSDAQRAALADAATEAAARSLDVLPPQDDLAAAACAGGARFAEASAAAIEELRAAVGPVYETLRADAATAAFLDEITAIKGDTRPDTVAVAPECRAG